jgi:hypothetical protein
VVKSTECPHISPESIERDRQLWGEASPQFRQKHLAEFTDEDEEAFISPEVVRASVDDPPSWRAGLRCAFIDWSTGGNETVIAALDGNRLQIIAAFHEHDAVQCVRKVAQILKDRHLVGCLLFADAGGIGAPMTDQLASEFGIFAKRINNNSPAVKTQEFANLDAERWFSFRRALEKRILIVPADGELLKQLSSRRLEYDQKARIQLESKDSMRARGLSSPDRADAVIGAVASVLSFSSGAISLRALGPKRVPLLAASRTLFQEDSDPEIPRETFRFE